MFSLFNASCGEVQPYPLRKKTAMVFNSAKERWCTRFYFTEEESLQGAKIIDAAVYFSSSKSFKSTRN